jgi:hypothetical protein
MVGVALLAGGGQEKARREEEHFLRTKMNFMI